MRADARGAVLVAVCFGLVLAACNSGEQQAGSAAARRAAPECSLSGRRIPRGVDARRAAVAVKVENNPAAPVAGLDKAELVYEELVEGGITRFLAFYHCTDALKVGPVRSARIIDPAIVRPITRVLAAAGGNAIVEMALRKARLVTIDEDNARGAMRRIARGGVAFEHTLFGDTAKLRRLARKRWDRAPRAGLFRFGPLAGKSERARSLTIRFSSRTPVVYRWARGKWRRFHGTRPFKVRGGRQIAVDNVLVEQHTVTLSKGIVDVAGNPSIEIKDVVGSGRAALFRDGRVVLGRWRRKTRNAPVRFVTAGGKEMALAPGTTWIELVPNRKGRVKGSFSFKKR